MVSRSDKVTTSRAQQDVFFSDLLTNFNRHPHSGNLIRMINESAVMQAVRNIILTDLGERLYQPTLGGDIKACLFEPIDGFTAHRLEDAIVRTVNNCEPRVSGIRVEVSPDPAQNLYVVNVHFTIFNSNETFNSELVLKRLR